MKECAIPPDRSPTARSATPPYDRIAKALTRLLADAGLPVRDGFLPQNQLSAYDDATRSLVLHPWIAPKQRAAILLREAVSRLARPDDEGTEEQVAWRRWARVEARVARHYATATDDEGDDTLDALAPHEQALVDRIIGAVEAPAQNP